MVRYLIFMSYIGTRYRGAAKQYNRSGLIDLDTIEGAVETALRTVLRSHSTTSPKVFISSRTDAGVHALSNTAQIELQNPENEIYNTKYIAGKVNTWFARCGHEIRINSMYPITEEFDARRSAKSRTYFYRFIVPKDSSESKIPIAELGRSWSLRNNAIDLEVLRKGLTLFMGRKNFSSFSPRNKTNRKINYVKELMNLTIEPGLPLMPTDSLSDGFDFWQINVTSRSFVYNQVRRIVGALLGLAAGKITERDIITMLQVPSHLNWHDNLAIAPPQGLYLKTIEYDREELTRCIIQPKEETVQLPLQIMF